VQSLSWQGGVPSGADKGFAALLHRIEATRGAALLEGAERVRVEVPLESCDPLAWLVDRADSPTVYWASRDHSLEVVGVGVFQHFFERTPDKVRAALDHLERNLSGCGPRWRAFGAIAFDPARPGFACGGGFEPFAFVLPRVEVGRDSEGCWMAAYVRATDPTAWAHDVAAVHALCRRRGAARALPAGFCSLPGTEVARGEPPRAPALAIEGLEQDGPRAQWGHAVGAALADIRAGAFQKVVLARRAASRFDEGVDAIEVLRRLSAAEPRSYRFCLRPRPNLAFVGASPERLVLKSQRIVRSEAIAGTRRRDPDPALDVALAKALLNSDKDRREQAFVRDSVAEALETLCVDTWSTDGPELVQFERVQHLWTGLGGALRPGVCLADILAALHPTPAVCGFPRKAAQERLAALEDFERGYYAGPVGWLGDGEAELAVGIRSAHIEGSTVSLFAGAGIVNGSVPDDEWEEVNHKLAVFRSLLGFHRPASPPLQAGQAQGQTP